MKKEELGKIQNSVVCCPYCREYFRVASGWFFADNPKAERDPKKFIVGMYVSNQVKRELKIESEKAS